MDYSKYPRHNVLCIDMKSFYASTECVLRGLDPLKTKMVVVGDINRNGSVVLASSPIMKSKYKIKTGSRLFEVKEVIRKYKDTSIIIAQARMEPYMAMSKRVVEIFQRFVPPESLHVYSVDESWLVLNGTEKLWGTPVEAARKIKETIYEETGLIAAVGIGENKFLAKFCLDVYGKKVGIAEARYEDVETMFHHLPVEEIWGIGVGISTRLRKMGISTIGELAHSNRDALKKEFGVVGEEIWKHAWGIDLTPVFHDKDSLPHSAFGFFNDDAPNEGIKSIGRGVTLLRDYIKREEILLAIRDLVQEVCELLRKRKLEGKTIHLSVGYSKHDKNKGFSRQISFKNNQTNDVQEIFDKCIDLFDKHHLPGSIVRQLRVSVGNLSEESIELITDTKKVKRKKVYTAMDILNEKLGKGKVRTASSYLEASITDSRINKIAGHTK